MTKSIIGSADESIDLDTNELEIAIKERKTRVGLNQMALISDSPALLNVDY